MQNGKELWISQIYFSMENPMDRVHGAWIGRHGLGPPWTEAARWRVGPRVRRCSLVAMEEDEPDETVLKGCPRSTSGDEEASRWRWRTATT
jgi:hypothetical protein